MSVSVYILDRWANTPVYHEYGRVKDDHDVSVCGLVLYDMHASQPILLRRDHADKFARPCAKCFPAAVLASPPDSQRESSYSERARPADPASSLATQDKSSLKTRTDET